MASVISGSTDLYPDSDTDHRVGPTETQRSGQRAVTAPWPQGPELGSATTNHSDHGHQADRRRSILVPVAASFLIGGMVASMAFTAGRLTSDTATGAQSSAVALPTDPAGAAIPDTAELLPPSGEPVADVAATIGPSVVQVETNRGQGSGVVYAEDLLLTNHHVIDGASAVQIRTSDGRVVRAEILGSDPRNDIAVLSAPGSGLPVAPIGSSAELAVGELTVAIGSPFRLQQTVTAGIVSATNRPVPNATGGLSAMIQTDAPINPGNSGGALANRLGELIGINASIRTDGTGNSNVGIGFAVPIDTAVAVAERIVDGDSLEPGVLGVTGDRQDDGIGVPVDSITAGSGADTAGLRVGDRVLTVNGTPVTDIGELVGLIQSNFSGDTVALEVDRNGNRLLLSATLS